VTSRTAAETETLGEALGRALRAGDVVLLYGDLGAGKTAFTKGLAEGLGVSGDDVSSPTFTIMQEYRGGRLSLFHVDLYRLNDPREVEDLGLDEIAADGVLAIEWAEKLPARLKPSHVIAVRITHGDGDVRSIRVDPYSLLPTP